MKIINDNLKKTGLFNTALILAAVILRLMNIENMSTLQLVDAIIACIGLLCGLIYSLHGYKKDVAKYYKIFMYSCFFSSLLSLIVPIILHGIILMSPETIFNIIHFVVLICTFLLVFINNFKEHNSKTTALIMLTLNCIVFINDLIVGRIFIINFASLALFVQAIIAYVLVNHKYIDKESRGAK